MADSTGSRKAWGIWIGGGALATVGLGLLLMWAIASMKASAPVEPQPAADAAPATATADTPDASAPADYKSPPNPPPIVTTMPAHLNKTQLLEMAQKREAAVQDLAVEYDYVPVEDTVAQQSAFHFKFARKAEKLYIDVAQGTGGDTSRFRTISAFNGSQWVQFQCYDSSAMITSAVTPPPVNAPAVWFNLAMIGAPGGPGMNEGSLVALLQSGGCLVHLNLQDVDGHHCVVVDDVAWSGVRERVWLDPARGLLPLRISFWSNGNEMMVLRTIEAVEAGGLWLPTWGESRQMGTVTRLEVRDRGTAHLGLHVNKGIPDDAFDLEKKLPADAIIAREGAPVTPPRRGTRRRGHRSDFDPGLPGE